MEKWIAGFLQAGAAALFFVTGLGGDDLLLLLAPATASGVAGLILWGRHARPLPPPEEPKVIAPRSSDRLEDAITALQADVAQLREDREFFRDLYAEHASRTHRLPG